MSATTLRCRSLKAREPSQELRGLAGSGIVEADVTGHLSFVGPTDTVNVPDCPFISCGQTLVEPITWSGFVTIQQGSHRFFSGSLHGTGTATALYGTFPPSQFWQGSDYTFAGVAHTLNRRRSSSSAAALRGSQGAGDGTRSAGRTSRRSVHLALTG